MAKIHFEGMKELDKKLKSNVTLNDVKKVIKQNTAELDAEITKKAEFKKGYQTGATKRSIEPNITANGMTGESGAKMDYDPYLEFGTRFMDAQPFIKPSFNKQKEIFKRDMNKLTK